MNIGQKRKELMDLIIKLDEARLDALFTLLNDPTDDLQVKEDDWAEMEYRRNAAKKVQTKMAMAEEVLKRVKDKIGPEMHLDEVRADAILTLLGHPSENFQVSEQDWAQVEQREKEVAEGKSTDTDAREAGKRILAALKKKRK